MPGTDLESLALDTDIAGAVAAIGAAPVPAFALGSNRVHVHQAKAADRASRRGIKQFIRPENADQIVQHLPLGADDRAHCVLRGDFVLCDLIPKIIERGGRCTTLRIATLGCSVANADTLACLIEQAHVADLTLVLSHYFAQVDGATVYRAVCARLEGLAKVVVTRCHAKVICIPTIAGAHYVIEGSANLRSSDNVEQITITNDEATHAFHAAWIDELAAA